MDSKETETKKELTKKLMDSLEKLSNEIVKDPIKLREFGENWAKGYHIYSFGNYLLILSQKWDATICRGYRQWQKLDRQVKASEYNHPINILAPNLVTVKELNDYGVMEEHKELHGFLGVRVYDISQTYGKEISLGHAERITGKCEFYWKEIAKLFPNIVITYNYDPTLSGGSASRNHVNIVPQDNKLAETARFFHELAHSMLHWEKDDSGNWIRLDIERSIAELQAESVSYLVCSVFGIDTSKFTYEYLGHWHGDAEKLGTSGTKILSCAEKIIKTIANPTKKINEVVTSNE
jgi:hypothetical protein